MTEEEWLVSTVAGEEAADVATASRRLEISLDYLLARTRDSGHLLDNRYAAVLTEGEQKLRLAMLNFQAGSPDEVQDVPAWRLFQGLLDRLGLGAGERNESSETGYEERAEPSRE